jgi:two-component sensor histidine kinase
LAEKEALLREIHHRVKNNLAVISSLLSLQARYAPVGVVGGIFAELQARIQSMALAHEALYQSENLARLNIRQYLSRLIDHLADSLGVIGKIIRIRKDIQPLSFTLDEAVLIGFIVTELVSNALKHAFPDRGDGEIIVSLHPTEQGDTVLVVADSGVGMQGSLDARAASSLGLRLVGIFVKQLRAEMSVNNDQGTEVSIRLKVRALGEDARPTE